MNFASKQGVSLNFSSLIRLWFRQRHLRRRQSWSREQINAHQQSRLKQLRAFTSAYSPFYQKFHSGLDKADLTGLPILTKARLMENWDEIVTDRSMRLQDVELFTEQLRKPRLFRDSHIVLTTSGSTGHKAVVPFSKQEWMESLVAHSRTADWAQLRPSVLAPTRMAMVSSLKPWCKSTAVAGALHGPLAKTLIIDSTWPIANFIEQLNRYQPQTLIAYPEQARLLAERQLAGELRIAPKYIFASAEVLRPAVRELAQRAWGQRVVDAYASTETSVMASDCAAGRMHLYEDLVIVENVNENNQPVADGEFGAKILVTVLSSRTLPLIRYQISDQISFDTRLVCNCGMAFRVITGIRGREEDNIHLPHPSGQPVQIDPDMFHDVLEITPVAGWQVVQTQERELTVYVLNPKPRFNREQLIGLLDKELSLRGAVGYRIVVERVSALQRTATGKTRLVKGYQPRGETRV